MSDIHPTERIKRGRPIRGLSAVLLPFDDAGQINWSEFRSLLEQTVAAGLVPAVNMDTGYVQLLDRDTRIRVLETARGVVTGEFVAGAFVDDRPGDPFDFDAYVRSMEGIAKAGGVPVVFPSHGLNALDSHEWVGAHTQLSQSVDRFIAFELGEMFVPYGRIYDLESYAGLMAIPACIGAKHSSLSREREWERLAIRDTTRPDFMVLTGNDLAIDMVMYGSDYLLGLSAFAPELFAKRDRYWQAEDPAFYELNDQLQYLGCFAFRAPVPAYKHDAALFLALTGRIACGATHPAAQMRPKWEADVLRGIADRLEAFK